MCCVSIFEASMSRNINDVEARFILVDVDVLQNDLWNELLCFRCGVSHACRLNWCHTSIVVSACNSLRLICLPVAPCWERSVGRERLLLCLLPERHCLAEPFPGHHASHCPRSVVWCWEVTGKHGFGTHRVRIQSYFWKCPVDWSIGSWLLHFSSTRCQQISIGPCVSRDEQKRWCGAHCDVSGSWESVDGTKGQRCSPPVASC